MFDIKSYSWTQRVNPNIVKNPFFSLKVHNEHPGLFSKKEQNRLILIFVISADSITPFWPLSATLPHFNVKLPYEKSILNY